MSLSVPRSPGSVDVSAVIPHDGEQRQWECLQNLIPPGRTPKQGESQCHPKTNSDNQDRDPSRHFTQSHVSNQAHFRPRLTNSKRTRNSQLKLQPVTMTANGMPFHRNRVAADSE
jgi:hypothetical protein